MPPHRLTDVVRRAAGVVGHYSTAPDRDLLGRFVADRDTDAFAELVRRHGAMVCGVCRRALGNTADADDACQATFLVLARKAAVVRRADAVGSWLYGVARRVAWKARVKRQASRERERPEDWQTNPPVAHAPGSPELVDLLAVLDEELARLPDAYRAPLVLCYLEGRTQDEAARQLGWSLGAFRGRLERGRARLRARLDRRGVGLAVLAAVAAADTAAGAVPAGVVGTIVTTATAVAAGEAVAVPAGVAALTGEVMRAMTMTKLQWAAGVVAVCGMLTAGGVWATGQSRGGRQGGQPPPGRGLPAAAVPEQPPERQAGPAQRRKSTNNLKQIMLAVHNYHDAFGHLPADVRGKGGKPLLSWRVLLLPYLEQDNLLKQFKLDEPWDSEHNLKLLTQMPAVYRIGIEPKDATHTYYQAFVGPRTPLGSRGVAYVDAQGRDLPPLGGFPPGAGSALGGRPPRDGEPVSNITFMNITDGTSNTLGVVEAGPPVPWTKPADLAFDPAKPVKPAGPFSNEWHAATMDGAAFALRPDIAPDVLRRLILMNDGEVVSLNDWVAPRVAETAEEMAQLKKIMVENQKLCHDILRQLMEHRELIADHNGKDANLDTAEEVGKRLAQLKAELEVINRKLRDERRAKP